MKDEIHNAIVSLYADFTSAVIMAKTRENGTSWYTDNDFDFQHFMDWLVNTNP